jgi:hypothetical protein
LIIEYDGFEFHFDRGVPARLINETTWRTYLTADDLEREKIVESFGVPMIRLNRFNLGKDPVAAIDRMIRERLDGLSNGSAPHEVVTKAADEAKEVEEGLKAGEYKRCRKCDRDLPLGMFQDAGAKSGLSRYCRDCKRSTGSTSYRSWQRRRYGYRR